VVHKKEKRITSNRNTTAGQTGSLFTRIPISLDCVCAITWTILHYQAIPYIVCMYVYILYSDVTL